MVTTKPFEIPALYLFIQQKAYTMIPGGDVLPIMLCVHTEIE
jgi:hypothetical protein